MRHANTRLPIALLLLVFVVTLIVYWPGLSGPLLTDDIPQLKGLIDQSSEAPGVLLDNYLVSNSGPLGRPVAMASFIGNALVNGPDIWWWKFTNLLLHLLAGGLVFCWSRLLILVTEESSAAPAWPVALVVTAIWLLHPLHISTVFYTVQRMTELSAIFVLAGMICYVQGRRILDGETRNGWLWIAAGFFVCFPLGLLSKESALLYPVYCSLLELVLFRGRGIANMRRQIKALHGTLLTAYALAGIYLAANFSTLVLQSYASRDFTLPQRLLTESRVLLLYIGQLLRPIQSKMGFFHDDLVVSTGLLQPASTLLALVAIAALLGSAIWLRKKLPLYAFGVLFYFAAQSLESGFFALELMFEHRNYLASLGILLALLALARQLSLQRRMKTVLAMLALISLSFLSFQRSTTWASAATMYDFMYYAHPRSLRLGYILADLHSRAGEYERARELLINVAPTLAGGTYLAYLDCVQFQQLPAASLDRLLQIQGAKLDGHVIANTSLLAEAVLEKRCSISEGSMLPLLRHLLSLPFRSEIDRQAVQMLIARFNGSRAPG